MDFSTGTRHAHDEKSGPVVRLVGQRLKAALMGLAAGYCLALLIGRSVWLEMRINVGHIIPISSACFVLLLGARKRPLKLIPFLLLEVITAAILFSIYGFSSSTILIVPAALFREGFHLNSLSLMKINLFLLCLVGVANAVWIYHAVAGRRSNG